MDNSSKEEDWRKYMRQMFNSVQLQQTKSYRRTTAINSNSNLLEQLNNSVLFKLNSAQSADINSLNNNKSHSSMHRLERKQSMLPRGRRQSIVNL
jgi:hypothetical protein